jgi:hypothetical protein
VLPTPCVEDVVPSDDAECGFTISEGRQALPVPGSNPS